MKSILIDEISDMVAIYEDKLTNSQRLENIIANKIMDALMDNYPEVMLPIYESKEIVKTDIELVRDELYDQYKQNIIDKNYMPIPRLVFNKTNSDKKYIELTPKQFLKSSITAMIYPIIMRNYSLVKRLEFLEYSIARIDDPIFYSNISNLVYLKDTLTNPFIDKLFSIGCNINGSNFLKEVSKAYFLATGKIMEKEVPDSKIYQSINNLIIEKIKENCRSIRILFNEYVDRIFFTYSKQFNLNRTFNGLERVELDLDTIDNCTFLLSNILDEMDYLKTLKTYYSNGYACNKDFNGINGFYCDNGSFIMIDSPNKSLIETIKSKILYRKYFGIDAKYLGVANPFKDFGFGYNLVEHEPFTTLIYNSCYDFMSLGKEKLTYLTLNEYKQKKKRQ